MTACHRLCECIVVCWVYGADKYVAEVEKMIGQPISRYWWWMWKWISPGIIIFILIWYAHIRTHTHARLPTVMWCDDSIYIQQKNVNNRFFNESLEKQNVQCVKAQSRNVDTFSLCSVLAFTRAANVCGLNVRGLNMCGLNVCGLSTLS